MDPTDEAAVLRAEPASAGDGACDGRPLTSEDGESNIRRCTTSSVDSPPDSEGSGANSGARCTGPNGNSAARLSDGSGWARRCSGRPSPSPWFGSIRPYRSSVPTRANSGEKSDRVGAFCDPPSGDGKTISSC